MRKAAAKDIARTIWKEKKRFISIMLITALGVTMMTGLSAGCEDLRYSADRFFDLQELFDISIQSTMGLTQEDVDLLAKLPEVEKAEGSYSEIVHTKKGDLSKTAEVKTFRQGGMNLPFVQEGRLPEKANEIAVTQNYIADTGKALGDQVPIEELLKEKEDSKALEEDYLEEEKEAPDFLYTEYTITAIVTDAMDINNGDSAAAFRATPNADYTFFVLPQAIDSEIYTAVYLSLTGTGELMCYTPEYEKRIGDFISYLEEEIKSQREQARYDQVTGEAYEKILDAEGKIQEEFADAERELKDARQEIEEGKQEIEDARQEIVEGRQELLKKEQEVADQLAEAKAQIEDGYRELAEGEQEIREADAQLYQGNLQLGEGRARLEEKEAQVREEIARGEAALIAKQEENKRERDALSLQVSQISERFGEYWPADSWNAYVSAAVSVLQPMMAGQAMEMENMTPEQQAALLQAAIGEMTALQPDIVNRFQQEFATLIAGDPTQDAQAFVEQMTGLALLAAIQEVIAGMLEQAAATLAEQKAYAESQLAAGWEEITKAEEELAAATAKIHEGKKELEENRQKLADAVREVEENEQKAAREFADAREEIAKGEQKLLEGEQELKEGQQELDDGLKEYREEKRKAEDKLAEAKAEVEKVDMTKWYIQDRTSLSGYVNVESDMVSIEALASVFTAVFFVVAILISLTTVTRMVEEERGLVGTYKALGFTDMEIRRKYVAYALLASLAGGVLGDFSGFVVLPKILFTFFDVMYLFPNYLLRFSAESGSIGMILFMVGIVGAAVWACETELKSMPAELMRPKAPRLGSRVFLERITPLWKRLSFLNKVTARNLFRYKKRMLMTILGIAGCTALVLFGFAIKDSVAELMPLQYERVYKYDLLAAASAEDNQKLIDYMEKSREVENYLNIQVETVKLKNTQGATEKVQIMVFPAGGDIGAYVALSNVDGEAVSLSQEGICLTENAAKTLGVKTGDTVLMQRLDLTESQVQITEVAKNYLGNNIYLSQEAYETAFGEYSPNGILANLETENTEQVEFADILAMEDWILSCVSTQELKEGFSTAFTLINLVVYVVLILAAGLAFVVLFTLASTNISERIRELSTIKVLGFFDREVHLYVNKETLILTGIGILLGLPIGALMSSSLTGILDMPSIYFAVTIYPKSFLISAGLSLVFTLLVQLLTDRSLDKINPVEALKSVE